MKILRHHPGSSPARLSAAPRRAFTMIELLVVITIIALLTTLVVTGANSALQAAKRRNTQQIMQNTLIAIDGFANENPLGAIYSRGDDASFGPFPPYQVAEGRRRNPVTNNNVRSLGDLLVRDNAEAAARTASLTARLNADLSGQPASGRASLGGAASSAYVRLATQGAHQAGDGNDDARALSAYLSAFSPRSLELVPAEALKPLNPQAEIDANWRAGDFINPRGGGGNPDQADRGWRNVLAIHDGWGVPLDYFLYVKIGVGVINGGREVGYKILDRRPVLMSRGLNREEYDTFLRDGGTTPVEPARWIYSEPLPTPLADGDVLDADGGGLPRPPTPNSFRTGWVRLVGDENLDPDDDEVAGYHPGFLPEYDPAAP